MSRYVRQLPGLLRRVGFPVGWEQNAFMHDRDVTIRDESIRLGQFLKLANAVDQGSDVKDLLATGEVRVNREVETRRGRRLQPGDEVDLADATYRVRAQT
jgi:ribosome-associated protein